MRCCLRRLNGGNASKEFYISNSPKAGVQLVDLNYCKDVVKRDLTNIKIDVESWQQLPGNGILGTEPVLELTKTMRLASICLPLKHVACTMNVMLVITKAQLPSQTLIGVTNVHQCVYRTGL